MRKINSVFAALLATAALTSCATIGDRSQIHTIDSAIFNAARQISASLPNGTMVAVLNISSDYEGLSDYVINQLIFQLVNTGTLQVLPRSVVELQMVLGEFDFQMTTGLVSPGEQQRIGNFLGADTVIVGSVTRVAQDNFNLTINAINVANFVFQAAFSATVQNDGQMIALTGTAQQTRRERREQERIARQEAREERESVNTRIATGFSFTPITGGHTALGWEPFGADFFMGLNFASPSSSGLFLNVLAHGGGAVVTAEAQATGATALTYNVGMVVDVLLRDMLLLGAGAGMTGANEIDNSGQSIPFSPYVRGSVGFLLNNNQWRRLHLTLMDTRRTGRETGIPLAFINAFVNYNFEHGARAGAALKLLWTF